jgi:hypothetical protein
MAELAMRLRGWSMTESERGIAEEVGVLLSGVVIWLLEGFNSAKDPVGLLSA